MLKKDAKSFKAGKVIKTAENIQKVVNIYTLNVKKLNDNCPVNMLDQSQQVVRRVLGGIR